MYLKCSKAIIVVEVDSSFALIDKSSGLIHVLDSRNLELYQNGSEFECHSTEMVIAAVSTRGGGSEDVVGRSTKAHSAHYPSGHSE